MGKYFSKHAATLLPPEVLFSPGPPVIQSGDLKNIIPRANTAPNQVAEINMPLDKSQQLLNEIQKRKLNLSDIMPGNTPIGILRNNAEPF